MEIPKAEKMKMKTVEAIGLSQGLNCLVNPANVKLWESIGFPVLPEGQRAYKFPGTVTVRLKRALQAMQKEMKAFEETRKELVEETQGEARPDGTKVLTGDAAKEFQRNMQEILNMEVEVELPRIKISELDLDKNSIPVELLIGVDKILIED